MLLNANDARVVNYSSGCASECRASTAAAAVVARAAPRGAARVVMLAGTPR